MSPLIPLAQSRYAIFIAVFNFGAPADQHGAYGGWLQGLAANGFVAAGECLSSSSAQIAACLAKPPTAVVLESRLEQVIAGIVTLRHLRDEKMTRSFLAQAVAAELARVGQGLLLESNRGAQSATAVGFTSLRRQLTVSAAFRCHRQLCSLITHRTDRDADPAVANNALRHDQASQPLIC